MKTRRSLVVPFSALALVGGGALIANAADPGSGVPAARLVTASITVDRELVLRASTSDDGHPDADEVWNYLLERLEFQPTAAFSSLGIDPASETSTIGSLESGENERRGEPPAIALEVDYGGHDTPFHLGLVRCAGQNAWRVDRKTVEDRFPHRRITRAQAAQLIEPRRRK